MRNLWLITKEDFLNLIKNPMWIFYAVGFPLLLVAILGRLTRNLYGDSVTSYDYYGVTLMLYSILSSGSTAANAFMEERIKKPNMRIIFAPGRVGDIYVSKIIASFLFSFLFHLLDVVILVLLFKVNMGDNGLVLVLFGEVELMSAAFGVMMCCIVKNESMTNQIQSVLVSILAVLGGLLFSLDGLGSFAARVSSLCPVKWIARAAFQVIYDHSTELFVPVIWGIAGCTLLMLLVCRLTFQREDCIC